MERHYLCLWVNEEASGSLLTSGHHLGTERSYSGDRADGEAESTKNKQS
jgi:hypothetical protein